MWNQIINVCNKALNTLGVNTEDNFSCVKIDKLYYFNSLITIIIVILTIIITISSWVKRPVLLSVKPYLDYAASGILFLIQLKMALDMKVKIIDSSTYNTPQLRKRERSPSVIDVQM
jgi:hypothetical protein